MYWSKFVISLLIGIILCKVSQVDAVCNPVGAFTCDNGDCIPIRNHCDNENDCSDGTDETTCDACLDNEIQCDTFCIPQTWQCDGVQDCSDGTDENDCTECNDWAFTCTSTGDCQPKSATCNGTTECDNGEDEQDCSGSCDEDHDFTCHNGECTQLCYVCDGERDCSDGSDEADCDMFAVTGELCFAYPAAANDLDIARECPVMGSACTPFTPVLLRMTLSETVDVRLIGYDFLDNEAFDVTQTAEMGELMFTALEEVDYIMIEIFWSSTRGTYDIETFSPCSRHNYCDFVKCEEMDSM